MLMCEEAVELALVGVAEEVDEVEAGAEEAFDLTAFADDVFAGEAAAAMLAATVLTVLVPEPATSPRFENVMLFLPRSDRLLAKTAASPRSPKT
jgi:hypothetical protein